MKIIACSAIEDAQWYRYVGISVYELIQRAIAPHNPN
jgi:hypothetical protein